MKLEHKVALVTGAGSGIGRASALRLAQEGAKVCCTDLRTEDAEETAKQIRDAGGDAIGLACNVADESQVIECNQQAISSFGQLDVLVTSAGNVTRGSIHELSLEDWNRVVDVQLTGTFLAAREALKQMVKQQSGVVITIGSVSSVVIGAGGSAASYKAAKGGVLQFTRAIATEYGHLGIRANCVCPGPIRTNLGKHTQEDAHLWTTDEQMERRQYQVDQPMKRSADPMEVANVVSFLASNESSFMTGSAVMVDGGYTAL